MTWPRRGGRGGGGPDELKAGLHPYDDFKLIMAPTLWAFGAKRRPHRHEEARIETRRGGGQPACPSPAQTIDAPKAG